MTVSETVAKGTASLVVFAAALVVTMAGSWVPSFWYDEAATLQLARLPLPEFFGFVMQRDAVHGLYAFIMHGWIQVFGESEFSVRFPSALAVAVGATGVFHLGRRWFGVAPGIVAVVVFVVLPRMTTQGIETRSYAMATALLVVAAVLVARARERRGWAPWIAVTAAATASVWMFAYGLFVLPALALLADDPTLARRTRVLRASAALVVPGLLAVPLVLTMIPQRGQVAWLSEQDVNLYTVLIEPMFGSAFWMVIGLALLVAVAVRAGWRVTLSRHVVSLLVWLLLPGTVLVTLSLAGTPVFTPRYLTVSAPALALLVGSLLGGRTSPDPRRCERPHLHAHGAALRRIAVADGETRGHRPSRRGILHRVARPTGRRHPAGGCRPGGNPATRRHRRLPRRLRRPPGHRVRIELRRNRHLLRLPRRSEVH